MKKLLLMFALVSMFLFGCSDADDTAQTEEPKQEEKTEDVKEEAPLTLGEPLKIANQDGEHIYTFTINSAISTEERNEFSEKNPEQVIILNYTYENVGLDEELLITSYDLSVIDSEGNKASTYPAVESLAYAGPAPKGAKSTDEDAFGLMVKSDKVRIVYTDGDFSQEFEIPID